MQLQQPLLQAERLKRFFPALQCPARAFGKYKLEHPNIADVRFLILHLQSQ
jgi:hypothetical protein